jgi:predicted AAA+ superfamily ATPase
VYEFSRSAQKIRQGGFKLYASDTGLLYALSPATIDGLTRALETAVYLELRRRRQSGRMGEVSLLKLPGGREVDFIWGDEAFGQAYALVQVCANMTDEKTRARELAALDEALAAFPGAPAAVVTLFEEGVEHLKHGDARVVPAWRWMLEG